MDPHSPLTWSTKSQYIQKADKDSEVFDSRSTSTMDALEKLRNKKYHDDDDGFRNHQEPEMGRNIKENGQNGKKNGHQVGLIK